MAFILKSSKLILSFSGVVRELNVCRFHSELLKTRYRELSAKNCLYRKYSVPKTNSAPRINLEQVIYQLDMDSRNKCRINVTHIDDIIAELQHNSSQKLNSHYSLLLLRCCGNFSLNLSADDRITLMHKVLSALEDSGYELEINHYNVLLAAYIQNEHKFSPLEFLNMLKKKSIEPNKITYQRLLRSYCHEGNIVEAGQLLEKMKSTALGINEDTFNSLIHGHCQAQDIEGALAIFNLMESKNFEPTTNSYLNLILGYAKRGDIQKIRELIKDCEVKNIILTDKEFLETVYILSINKHGDCVDEILSMCKKQYKYRTHALHCMQRLLEKNLDKDALKVFETLQIGHDAETEALTRSHKHLIEYIVKYRDPKRIMSFINVLKAQGIIETPLALALRELLMSDDISKALQFFKVMHQRKISIRPHYFWPLLIKASKKGNEYFLEILKEMKSYDLKINYLMCVKVIHGHYKFGEDWMNDLNVLHSHGVPKRAIAQRLLVDFLQNQNETEAIKLASKIPIDSGNYTFAGHLAKYLMDTGNVDFIISIMNYLLHDVYLEQVKVPPMQLSSDSDCIDDTKGNENEGGELENSDLSPNEHYCTFTSTIISSLLEIGLDPKTFTLLLEKLLEKQMPVPENSAQSIREKIPDETVNDLLTKLTDLKNLKFQLDDEVLQNKMDNQKIEEPEGDPALSRYFQFLMKTIESEGAEKAVEYCMNKLENLISENDMTDEDNNNFKYFCMKVAQTGNVEAVERILDFGRKLKILTERNFYPLVRAYLSRDELDKAVDVFCDKVRETKCSSSWKNMLDHVIKSENMDLLQKVSDAVTEVEGEHFTLAALIMKLSDLGMTKEVKRILASKDFRIAIKSVRRVCGWLRIDKSIRGFETLLNAAEGLSEYQQMLISTELLLLLVKERNTVKIKELCSLVEERNITPTIVFFKETENYFKMLDQPAPDLLSRRAVHPNDISEETTGVQL